MSVGSLISERLVERLGRDAHRGVVTMAGSAILSSLVGVGFNGGVACVPLSGVLLGSVALGLVARWRVAQRRFA